MTARQLDDRQHWLSVIAKAPAQRLGQLSSPWIGNMSFEWLRRPEVGLYLAQGRIDGGGDRFNLADVTVTRCAVRSQHQTVGVGYVLGRSHDHARAMACLDALLQVDSQRESLLDAVIRPLHDEVSAERNRKETAAMESKVQFYTLTPDTSGAPIGATK